MIDLTVKTLDSQNHAFSLNDDITVRQFKEHIADTVNISADLQRLIYCGRVLQDEKLLNEYDVNGKVIHLVQRAPPSSSQRSHSTNQNQGQNHGGSGEWHSTPRVLYRHTQIHDDPMYIGSFSIPADVLEGHNHEFPSPQLSNVFALNHLTVVRRMLDQANEVIDRLDNPSVPNTGSTVTNENNSSSSTQSNQTQSTTASAASESGSVWTDSGSTTEVNPPTIRMTDDGTDIISITEVADENIESSQQESQDDTTPQHSTSTPNQASSSESNDTTPNDALVPRELAELLELLLTTQDRLRPYIRNRLLSNPGTEWRQNHEENQRIIDSVTECFHFLSHAQHALSNLNINMQQPPPRTLRCRPMVVLPSAILQAGLPIQVEAHISLHGQNENNPDGDDGGTNNTPTRPSTGTTQTTTSTNNDIPASVGAHTQSQFRNSTPDTPRQTPRQQQSQSQTAFGTVFNFPNNVEVLMESSPQTPRVWSFSTGDSQGSSNNNNNNNVTNNNNGNSTTGPNGGGIGVSGNFPWGAATTPDFIRNLIQAVTGYMTQNGIPPMPTAATTTSSSSSPSTTANQSSNATPMGCPRHRTPTGSSESTGSSGQNSQTRGNTETHPTTSTQTRTTSRTHVFHQHAQALGVGVGLAHSLDFDPYLPCNSNHIRRANTSSSSSSTSASTATTNIAASTQTGGQSNVSTGTHTPSQARNTVTSSSPRVTTVRGIQVFDLPHDNSLAETIANLERVSHHFENGIPFVRLLSHRGTNLLPDFYSRPASLTRTIFNVLGNIPVHLWFRLVRNDLSPLTESVIQTLRTQMRDYCGRTLNIHMPTDISRILCNELRVGLERTFDGECAIDETGRAIDIYGTVNKMLEKFLVNLGVAVYSDEIIVTNIVQIIRDFGRDLSAVLRYSLRGGQSGLERVIARFACEMSRGTHERFRVWILGTVAEWFFSYTRQVAPIDNSKIIEFLVYKADVNEVATTSSETTNNKPESLSEPMEVDTESNSHPPTHNTWMDDEEIIAATFPGDESLMPDWIPIVARDAVTQRRQLSLSDDDVTTMSDAYLSTMPSKRRKLVEQRKAPLLVNPSSNRSAIPSSMERMMRDSVGRAGFEEVDGAVAAIVGDPTVRRAFGQAIRESLNPRRYQTPDFPDALRFPNATKFFINPNRPAKQ